MAEILLFPYIFNLMISKETSYKIRFFRNSTNQMSINEHLRKCHIDSICNFEIGNWNPLRAL